MQPVREDAQVIVQLGPGPVKPMSEYPLAVRLRARQALKQHWDESSIPGARPSLALHGLPPEVDECVRAALCAWRERQILAWKTAGEVLKRFAIARTKKGAE